MTTPPVENVPTTTPAPVKHTLRFYQRWWILANAMTDGLLQYLWQAIYRFSKHGTREAAALSYYGLFSLFPLMLLLIVVIGTILGPAAARSQIDDGLRLFLPKTTAEFLQDNIAEALEQRSSFGIVAGIMLLWSSLGLFSNLSSALSRTFRDEKGPNTWQSRLIGMGMMIALALLLVASLASTLLFRLMDLLFFFQATSWLTMGALIIPLSASVAIFAFLYRFIPRRRVRWDAIWVAAFLAGGAWEIAKRGFGWYLDNLASYSLVYGSVATVIVLMLWIYVSVIIILLGAEICAGLDDWMNRKSVQDLDVPYTD
ncbi:MAG: YihY/virulence factor BrkB family protein [Anaerolineae bacterium]|nr:YihY/virulence factor BrkB family protein [Anaerolineae bacterium]